MFKKAKATKFGTDAEYWRPLEFVLWPNTDRREQELPNDNSDLIRVKMALYTSKAAYHSGAEPIETKYVEMQGNDSPVKYVQLRNALRGNLVDMDEWSGAEDQD